MDRPVVVVTLLVALLVAGLSTGCQDPCVTLAERICNCEKTADERRACITDRVSNQQSTVDVSPEDQQFCTDKLISCTCAALDNNDLDACGFANGDQDAGE